MKALPIGIAAAVLAAGGGLWLMFGRSRPAPEVKVKLATASKSSLRKTVSASGTLQPWTTVDVKSKAGGRIDLLAVDVGAIVKSGQVIAKIDPTDSELTFRQAKADTDSALAKEAQSSETYQLQIAQNSAEIDQARASLNSSLAAQKQAEARLLTAQTESRNQPALAMASVRQAEASLENARKDRAMLDSTQAQDRASSQSAYDQALANDISAQSNLRRQKALYDKGYVSGQTVESAQAAADVTKAQTASAKAKLDTLGSEQKAAREASNAQVTQAQAQLQSARTQTYSISSKQNSEREAKAAVLQAQAQVQQAQASLSQAVANRRSNGIKKLDIDSAAASKARAEASLSNAKTTLDQTVVRAPSDGVVLQKYVEQGTIITSGLSMNSTGTSIVQLGEIARMYVDVSVDETDISSVEEGQKVDVSFDAYPGIPFQGRVAKINPQAVVESNVTTIHVRVEVDNSSPTFRLLKPAMNATCDFIVGEASDVLAVPTEAVKTENEMTYVETAAGGHSVPNEPGVIAGARIEKKTVEIGLEGTDATEIKSGISAGDNVVVEHVSDQVQEEAAAPKKGALGNGMPGPPPRGGR